MSNWVMIPLSLTAWVFTLFKFQSLRWENMHKDEHVALNTWLALPFFSVTLTFLIVDVAAFFDTYTLPNLSVLVAHCSFLVCLYFGTTPTLSAFDTASARKAIRWIRLFLVLAISLLLALYFFFLSKMPPSQFFVPQNLAEVIFKSITCIFGIIICVILIQMYIAHFPSKDFALLRLRTGMIIFSTACTGIYLSIRIVIFLGYFWSIFSSEILFNLASLLLVLAALSYIVARLSDKIYARFVLTSTRIQKWHTYRDLQYLIERLMLLCPVIGLPYSKPNFFKFLLDPEVYLYRAIIIILDSQAMLSDFLTESAKPETSALWEDDLLQDAIRINQVLQSTRPSTNDFADIVKTYRQISRELLSSQKASFI